MDEPMATGLFQLPVELGMMILEYISPRDVSLSFAPLCRQAYAIHDQPLLWASFYRRFAVDLSPESEEDDMARLLDLSQEEETRRQTATRRRWERVWLLDAGMTVGDAINRSHSVDWKSEYVRRVTFKVLVLAHHGAHGSSRYDISACQQLKKQNITHLRICHPDCPASKSSSCDEKNNGGFQCVPFTPDVAKGFSSILLFHASAPSDQARTINKITMGNVLYEHLESGGGLCEPTLGEYDKQHPVMNGVSKVRIDMGRDTARCKTAPRPGARVVASYADGPPLVVMYDSKANKANAERKTEAADDDKDYDYSNPKTPDGRTRAGEVVRQQVLVEDEGAGGEEETWGKTVYINLFPVSNESPSLGGWYPPAPQSDIPRLLSNALYFVARRK